MEEQIKAVRNMQDYIEAHLYEMITPAEYIRKLRLSKSALKLRDEKIKIVDVAFEVGFQSVDGYQRAFYREFGCNPKEYAKAPVPLYLFTPYGILPAKKREEHFMSETRNVFVHVIQKPARKVLIKRGIKAKHYYEYCEEEDYEEAIEEICGYLDEVTGVYTTPAGYFVNGEEAEEFDKQFPPKEKKKLPGQIF